MDDDANVIHPYFLLFFFFYLTSLFKFKIKFIFEWLQFSFNISVLCAQEVVGYYLVLTAIETLHSLKLSISLNWC